MTRAAAQWPKHPLQLTSAEETIKDRVFVDAQTWGYRGLLGWVQRQGHLVVERLSRARWQSNYVSLDLGCGIGYHFHFVQGGRHVGVDKREALIECARQIHPAHMFVKGDAYAIPFPARHFDRVVSVYVLEHLERLPWCLAEVHRVLRPAGEFLFAVPCEGGLAYEIGRRVTTKRYFERRYAVDYMRLVRSEHCNTSAEVMTEVRSTFAVKQIRYLPFGIPSIHLNAVVVMRCVPLVGERKRP